MSKQLLPLIEVADDGTCCAPLAAEAVSEQAAMDLAPAFKALGDPVRLRLLSMIASAEGGEMCVCDLTPAFDLSGPTISHHLKSLREADLVSSQRRGTWVYYRANRAKLGALSAVLDIATPIG